MKLLRSQELYRKCSAWLPLCVPVTAECREYSVNGAFLSHTFKRAQKVNELYCFLCLINLAFEMVIDESSTLR
jgi:hypothetical protein